MTASSLTVDVGGRTIWALTEGPADGVLALLLHGFPDSPHTWRHLMGPLAEAGYRAVAPAMRGYAPSGPAADGRYDTGTLGRDVNDLHEALSGGRPGVLIGHDWGADAVYSALLAEPRRWSAAVAAADPPMAERPVDLVSRAQLRRSWYSYLLQLGIGPQLLRGDDFALVADLWADWSPGYDATEDVQHAKAALAPPGCAEAAAQYYVQDPTALPSDDESRRVRAALRAIDVPLLYLHGLRDGCIGVDVLDEPAVALPASAHVQIIDEAGHFLHLEQPGQVARLVLEHVTRP
ncbi:MAG: alpha/beta hydrolase fold protein [Frankiales bacterium]|nr:alpha/beta hydrolase fold protein [Frankiales bacterium]